MIVLWWTEPVYYTFTHIHTTDGRQAIAMWAIINDNRLVNLALQIWEQTTLSIEFGWIFDVGKVLSKYCNSTSRFPTLAIMTMDHVCMHLDFAYPCFLTITYSSSNTLSTRVFLALYTWFILELSLSLRLRVEESMYKLHIYIYPLLFDFPGDTGQKEPTDLMCSPRDTDKVG